MISLLQTKVGVAVASSNPVNLVFANNTVTGNTIFVAVVSSAGGTASGITVTDSNSNSYTAAFTAQADGDSTTRLEGFYAFNVTGGTTPTVHINNPNANGVTGIIREYSGLLLTDPLDKSVTTSGTLGGSSGSISSGASASTSQPFELVLGVFSDDTTGQTYTIGSGYRNLSSVTAGTGVNVGIEDKIVSTDGTQTATLTLGASSNGWAAAVVTFKAIRPSFKPNALRPAIFKPGLAR